MKISRSWYQRVLVLLLVPLVLLSMLVAPASAATVEGTLRVELAYYSNASNFTTSVSMPREVSTSEIKVNSGVTGSLLRARPVSFQATTPALTGNIAFYVSFFFIFGYSTTGGNVTSSGSGWNDASLWTATYVDPNGTTGEVFGGVELSAYTPATSYRMHSIGLNVTGRFIGFEDFPIYDPALAYTGTDYFSTSTSSSNMAPLSIVIPSASVVATATSGELDALEDMADAIVEQNEILSAMYGDVISVLNSIYSRLGDMQAAMELTNTYLQQVVEKLTSLDQTASNIYSLLGTYLHYLQSISETADNIYSELQSFHTDFMSMIELLIGTVQAESDDIQAKMEEIYNLLIAYLDNVFSSAVNPDLEQGIEDTNDVMGDSSDIENVWTGNMMDGWGDLDLDAFAFGAQFLSAAA